MPMPIHSPSGIHPSISPSHIGMTDIPRDPDTMHRPTRSSFIHEHSPIIQPHTSSSPRMNHPGLSRSNSHGSSHQLTSHTSHSPIHAPASPHLRIHDESHVISIPSHRPADTSRRKPSVDVDTPPTPHHIVDPHHPLAYQSLNSPTTPTDDDGIDSIPLERHPNTSHPIPSPTHMGQFSFDSRTHATTQHSISSANQVPPSPSHTRLHPPIGIGGQPQGLGTPQGLPTHPQPSQHTSNQTPQHGNRRLSWTDGTSPFPHQPSSSNLLDVDSAQRERLSLIDFGFSPRDAMSPLITAEARATLDQQLDHLRSLLMGEHWTPKPPVYGSQSQPRELSNVKTHWFTLAFSNKEFEADFQQLWFSRTIRPLRRSLLLLYATLLVNAIYTAAYQKSYWLPLLIMTLIAAALPAFVYTRWFRSCYDYVIFISLFAGGIAKTIVVVQSVTVTLGMYGIIAYLFIRSKFLWTFVVTSIDLLFFIIWQLANDLMRPYELFRVVFLYVCLLTFCAYVNKSLEEAFRRNFFLQRVYQHERERSQAILDNMLPPHITKQMRALKMKRRRASTANASADNPSMDSVEMSHLKGLSGLGDDFSFAGEARVAATGGRHTKSYRKAKGSVVEDGKRQPASRKSSMTNDSKTRSLPDPSDTDGIYSPNAPTPVDLHKFDHLLTVDLSEVLATSEPEVSILFCDLLSFTSLMAIHTPRSVVAILDAIYSIFDELCVSFGVQKMETVGKTYMACAGLNGTRRDHAQACAEMALEMIALMSTCVDVNGCSLDIRIGIHTGNVIAGVVGLTRPQFCLFGDTVNTASRMQSTGAAGRVHISEVTHQHLCRDYTSIARNIEVKGKGRMTTYWLGTRKTPIHANRQVMFRTSLTPAEESIRIKDDQHVDETSQTPSTMVQTLSQKTKKDKINSSQLLSSQMTSSEDDPDMVVGDDTSTGKAVRIRAISRIFEHQSDEQEFQHVNRRNIAKNSRRPALVAIVFYIFEAIMEYLDLSHDDATSTNIATIFVSRYVFVAIAALLIWGSFKFDHFAYNAGKYNTFVFAVGMIADVAVPLILRQELANRYVLSFIFCLTLVSNSGSLSFVPNIIVNVCSFIGWFFAAVVVNYQGDARGTIFVVIACISNLSVNANKEYSTRREFVWTRTVKGEKEKADRILYSMLPALVANELKDGHYGISQKYEGVTILYSDIKGFTKYSARSTPDKVVKLLSQIFSAFDRLSHRHNVYKVQTIGDAYVLVAGFPFLSPGGQKQDAATHARACARMAQDMLAVIKRVRTPENDCVEIRIGMHTGDVIAGCIGTKQLRYDIWGSDCLVANTMEENGIPSGIVVSEVTAKLLQDRYALVEQPPVTLKDKTTIRCYAIHYPLDDPSKHLRIKYVKEDDVPKEGCTGMDIKKESIQPKQHIHTITTSATTTATSTPISIPMSTSTSVSITTTTTMKTPLVTPSTTQVITSATTTSTTSSSQLIQANIPSTLPHPSSSSPAAHVLVHLPVPDMSISAIPREDVNTINTIMTPESGSVPSSRPTTPPGQSRTIPMAEERRTSQMQIAGV